MKCPKCPGKLKEITVENVKVDICWICEGIWFDKDELEKVLMADSKNFNLNQLGHSDMDGKEIETLRQQINDQIGACPRCSDGTNLNKENYVLNPKVEIDVCPKGHGIWLDGGEVQLLRKRTLADIVHNFDEFKVALSEMFSNLGNSLRYGKRVE